MLFLKLAPLLCLIFLLMNTDLQLIAPAEVTEGQSAVLTCKTTCSLTDPTFIWYKNRRDLTTKTIMDNEVHLQPVSSEDAGSYSCAVRGYEHLPSPAQNISVRSRAGQEKARPEETTSENTTAGKDTEEANTPPTDNTSCTESDSPQNVSISSSGEIVEGSSVTLTCSSDANPPVEIYTWFKGTALVGKEKTYTILNISSEDNVEYKCKCSNEVGHQNSSSVTLNVLLGKEKIYTISNISSKDSGQYKCKCSNEVGHQNSSSVTLNVLSVGSGQSYRALQSGQYYCQAQNKHGSDRSAAVSVTLNGFQRIVVYAGFGVLVFVCICLIITCFLVRKKKRIDSVADQSLKQDDFSTNIVETNPIDRPSDSDSSEQDEVLYASIVHKKTTDSSPAVKASASEEDEVQYASVRFTHTGADY
ncbi:B-cell receptor CD22-like, partial [Clarias magur]